MTKAEIIMELEIGRDEAQKFELAADKRDDSESAFYYNGVYLAYIRALRMLKTLTI